MGSAGSSDAFTLHTGLSYGQDPRQIIDLFVPTRGKESLEPLPLFVYLHGGAWRSESIAGSHDLGAFLAGAGSAAVALVEYRLSLLDDGDTVPRVQHPLHLLDVYAALEYLLDERNAATWHYDARNVVVAGHSAGAWMVSSMLLDAAAPPLQQDEQRIVSACPRFSPTSRAAIKAYVGIDGLYDLVYLVEKYPSYMSFVSQAFYKTPIDTKDTYTNDELQPLEKVSINRWRLAMPEDGNQQHKGAHRPRFFFLHSREDTLLDVEYEQQALDFFAKSGVDLHVDLDTLRGDHDEATHTQAFFTLLQKIISS